jgi:signal transduction histidine kinase
VTDVSPAARDARAVSGWLAAQQDVAGRAAHELKNTLNGVAVNLEVVRSRLARPGVQPEQVHRFAEAAADQLERLTRQVEALLGLVRAGGAPADVGAVAAQLLALRPPSEAETAVRIGECYTGAPVDAVRTVLAAVLYTGTPALDVLDDGRVRLRVAGAASVDSIVRAVAADVGIELHEEGGPDGPPTLTLKFPERGHAPAETDP